MSIIEGISLEGNESDGEKVLLELRISLESSPEVVGEKRERGRISGEAEGTIEERILSISSASVSEDKEGIAIQGEVRNLFTTFNNVLCLSLDSDIWSCVWLLRASFIEEK